MNGHTSDHASEHVAGCVALAVGDTLRVVDPDAVLVYVPQGRVWITEEGGGDDIVLQEGTWWRLRRPGMAVVEALAPTVLMLTSPSAERPARVIETHDRPVMSAGCRAGWRMEWGRVKWTVRKWRRLQMAPFRGWLATAGRTG